ncbi:transmembrane 220 family protein [Puniceicoccaceae bacterium K14]|nr:transmembrane 220 family protein [Puniceicoccaceae bacterium K14]
MTSYLPRSNVNMLRVINIAALVAFLLSVFVQFNDPDPLLWIIVYSMASLSCILFSLKKPTRLISTVTCASSTLWIVYLFIELARSPIPIEWDSVFMQTSMKTISVELAREIGGLLIVAVWMLVLALKAKR